MQIKLQFSLTKPALIQDWVSLYLFIYPPPVAFFFLLFLPPSLSPRPVASRPPRRAGRSGAPKAGPFPVAPGGPAPPCRDRVNPIISAPGEPRLMAAPLAPAAPSGNNPITLPGAAGGTGRFPSGGGCLIAVLMTVPPCGEEGKPPRRPPAGTRLCRGRRPPRRSGKLQPVAPPRPSGPVPKRSPRARRGRERHPRPHKPSAAGPRRRGKSQRGRGRCRCRPPPGGLRAAAPVARQVGPRSLPLERIGALR